MSTLKGAQGDQESSFTFEHFLALHKNQLQNSCVPELYWQTLFIKLKNEVFDAGAAFQIMCVQTEEDDADDDDDDDDDNDKESAGDGGQATTAQQCWKVVVTAEEGIKCQDQRQ